MRTPMLETDRLILRPLTMDDAEAVFAWTGDPVVNEFMNYTTHTDVAFTRDWLSRMDNDSDSSYNFGFVRKEDGRLVGSGGVFYHPDTGEWHFGYNVRRDAWGRGYATEAMKRIIAFAHQELNAKDFISEHALENEASGRVIEKCGLRFSHYGSYEKMDGSRVFQSKCYAMHLE